MTEPMIETICADCGGTFWRKHGELGTPLCRGCGIKRLHPGDPEAAKAAMDDEIAAIVAAVLNTEEDA
jgi:DNA-directed RNA polymerase subunit RPC12/RpoP